MDLIEWLGELVRQVDSSLLDEWEQLANPVRRGAATAPIEERATAVTANARAFRVLVRNAMFRRVELAALERYDDLGELDAGRGWDADRWADAMDGYFEEHDELRTGPDARGPEAAADRGGPRTRCGASARSSTTRRATTTGASAPRSTCAGSDEAGRAVVTRDLGRPALRILGLSWISRMLNAQEIPILKG